MDRKILAAIAIGFILSGCAAGPTVKEVDMVKIANAGISLTVDMTVDQALFTVPGWSPIAIRDLDLDLELRVGAWEQEQ